MDAARRHAHMRGLDDHRHAARPQHMVDGVADLRGEPFLDLQALGENVHDARELGDADHAPGRQVADMRLADDRHDMMLAMAFQADVAHHDHLVIVGGFLEGALQHGDRVFAVACEELAIGPEHPVRRADKALAGGVVACPAQQGAHGFFGLRAARSDQRGAVASIWSHVVGVSRRLLPALLQQRRAEVEMPGKLWPAPPV